MKHVFKYNNKTRGWEKGSETLGVITADLNIYCFTAISYIYCRTIYIKLLKKITVLNLRYTYTFIYHKIYIKIMNHRFVIIWAIKSYNSHVFIRHRCNLFVTL